MRVRIAIFRLSERNAEVATIRRVTRIVGICSGLALLSACAGDMIPEAKRRGHRPATNPPPRYTANSPEFKMCANKLSALGARYTPLPDKRYGSGCDAIGALNLDQITVPVTGIGPMTCPLAQNFAAWARYGVLPAARVYLGSEVVRIDTFGTYSCRNIAGSGRLSEHAHANAIDISAFLLADGRRISVQNGWSGDDASRKFLRAVRQSACKRFRTVLSPDYNAAHHDHLHFDMGSKGIYCR